MAEGAPFRVADPGMTFILLGGCRDLAALGRGLRRDVAEIESWIATLERGASDLWNPAIGAYDGRDLRTGAFAGALTNASYLCWLGGLDDDRMLAKFDGMLGRVPYPVPSLEPTDARFDARRYWRGPTWAIMNALIGLGLAAQGHEAQAQSLRRRTAHLIAEHGFAEYFDPLTGAPAGGGTFTWTAAVWLAWASPRARGA
jgi:hypothetical protein